jgi:hypothetical protein
MDTIDDENISSLKRKVSSAFAAEEVRAHEIDEGASGFVRASKHARTARKEAKAKAISANHALILAVPRVGGVAAMDTQQLDRFIGDLSEHININNAALDRSRSFEVSRSRTPQNTRTSYRSPFVPRDGSSANGSGKLLFAPSRTAPR